MNESAAIAAQMFGNATQMVITEDLNKKNRKYQDKARQQTFAHDLEMANFNFEHAEKSADNAFARQNEMWNKNNAYNSASAQRSRLEEAGLNPALAYGSGGGTFTPATSGSAPQASGSYGSAHPAVASRDVAPQISNPLDDMMRYQQIKIAKAQEQNIQQDTENKRTQRDNMWIDFQNNYLDYQFNRQNVDTRQKLYDLDLSLKELDNSLKSKDVELKKTDLNLKKEDYATKQVNNEILKLTKQDAIDTVKENLISLRTNNSIDSVREEKARDLLVAEIVEKYANAFGSAADVLLQFLPAGALKKLGGSLFQKTKKTVVLPK